MHASFSEYTQYFRTTGPIEAANARRPLELAPGSLPSETWRPTSSVSSVTPTATATVARASPSPFPSLHRPLGEAPGISALRSQVGASTFKPLAITALYLRATHSAGALTACTYA
ncbi:hypothetical protein CCHR01_14213 [Colletotrichum chrysophilum]|uniref:Uncharacterized protein n=1 Tax=Colletotrichum chrysophilum TaxID=1836956 RepID=A0AAD9A832_9PEZI|nr:hypothetical protein CCHR01_14213 [Colletotrichum chrysophilum]